MYISSETMQPNPLNYEKQIKVIFVINLINLGKNTII